VSSDTLITVWKNIDNNQDYDWEFYMNSVAEKGYQILLSAPWYLNVISYGEDYREYYEVEPTNFTSEWQSTF
jgi:hexosaminidase